MSAKEDLITVETYVQEGKHLTNHLFIYYEPHVNKCTCFAICVAKLEVQLSHCANLASQLSFHPYKIRKQSEQTYV